MNYVDMAVAIKHCLDRCATALDGRDAKEWALAAAILIDKVHPPTPSPDKTEAG